MAKGRNRRKPIAKISSWVRRENILNLSSDESHRTTNWMMNSVVFAGESKTSYNNDMPDPTLDYYCSLWGLKNPTHLLETSTSQIIRVSYESKFAVLKLLTPLGVKEEGNSADALDFFDGQGSVRLLKFDQKALLLEYLRGDPLVKLVQRNEDGSAIEILCEILRDLHQPKVKKIPLKLIPLKLRFHSLLQFQEQATSVIDKNLLEDARTIANELLSQPLNSSVLHGDLHHENILHSPSRGWLAIDPKGLIGETTYDAANLFYNPNSIPAQVLDSHRIRTMAHKLSEAMNVDQKRLYEFSFCHGILSAIWNIDDGHDFRLALQVAEKIRMLL